MLKQFDDPAVRQSAKMDALARDAVSAPTNRKITHAG